ncbi:hypothetical protein [Solimicrobium silvestre]|uniref:hypothetical protein n=1 Tax=Solimicrobium silvestre TaxID=2099400 RepID=UPI0010572F53|nr:hypothetical protein [Solimicrobium silvestre]
MNLFNLFGHYFWVISIVVSLQVFWQSGAVRERCKSDVEFAIDDSKVRWKLFLWMCAPWFAMGIGQRFGGVPTVWHFLKPGDGNPWVALFFLSVFGCWLLAAYWVYLRDGANAIVEHQLIRINGLTGQVKLTPNKVKLVVALMLIGGIAAALTMFSNHMVVPIGID